MTVEAHDLAGNVSESSKNFHDRIPPLNRYLTNIQRIDFNRSSISWSSSDNVAVSSYELYIGSSSVTPIVTGGNSYVLKITGSKPINGAKVHIYIRAIDSLGNKSQLMAYEVYVGGTQDAY